MSHGLKVLAARNDLAKLKLDSSTPPHVITAAEKALEAAVNRQPLSMDLYHTLQMHAQQRQRQDRYGH